MREDERSVYINDYEHRLLVKGLSEYRNDLIQGGMPTEDVDDLLLKIIDAPYRYRQNKESRNER